MKHLILTITILATIPSIADLCDSERQWRDRLLAHNSRQALYNTQLNEPEIAKRTIILVHGLNNPNTLMLDLKNSLDDGETRFINLALKGHQGLKPDFISANSDQWMKQLYAAYCYSVLQRPLVPVHVIGFSLGGAITMATVNEKQIFPESITLFAPAVELNGPSRAIAMANYLPNKWVVPSQNLPEFKVMDGSSMALYSGLDSVFTNFQENKEKHKAQVVRGLVMVGNSDSLVSAGKLKETFTKPQWKSNWEVVQLDTSDKFDNIPWGHLVVVKKFYPEAEWLKILDRVKRNLAGN